jgi:hypothetical protein
MWSLWLVCLVLTPGALWLQHETTLQLGMISSIRVGSLVAFLWLVLAWLWPVRAHRNRMLALTVTLTLTTHLLTGVALGWDWPLSERVALATAVQAAVTLAWYRWRIGDDNLTPHRPSDIVDLAQASIIGALVAIPLGPAPGVWLDSSGFQLLWWIALSTTYVFVGSASIMLLVQRRPRTEAIPTRLTDVYLQLLVAGV